MKKATSFLALLALCSTLALTSCGDGDSLAPKNDTEQESSDNNNNSQNDNGEDDGPDFPIHGDNRIILYTSVNGQVVEPDGKAVFGANIVSNTYEDGWGKILFDGEVTSIGNDAFVCSSLTSMVIPNSVKKIESGAFYHCKNLTSVEIPNSVTTIGSYAFAYCESLTSVKIPSSVTEIGDCVFQTCSNLESFTGKFASDDHRCLIVNGELNSFAPAGLTSYSIPNSVRWIGFDVFHGYSSLTSVVIPNSVTWIEYRAFSGCTGLTSVEIPSSVTGFAGNVFCGCTSLTSFTGKYTSEDHRCLIVNGILKSFSPAGLTSYSIPNTVTLIGSDAFEGAFGLTSVVIPNSVTGIGGGMFTYCSGLKEITSLNTTPPTVAINVNSSSSDYFSNRVLKVPAASVDAYKAAYWWTWFTNIVGI